MQAAEPRKLEDPPGDDAPPAAPEPVADKLLTIVGDLYAELHRDAGRRAVSLRSSLDSDLGFDSLARVELLLRIEKAFGVRLGDEVLSTAESVRDLLEAVDRAQRLPRTAPSTEPRSTATPARRESGLDVPAAAATLVDVLQWHARRHPERIHIVYHGDADRELPISYGTLMQHAQRYAGALATLGLEPRQTVAIMLPTCPEYFYTFFGILLAGGVPVPIYPPARPSQIGEHVRRHATILANAATSILVTTAEVLAVARLLKARTPELRRVVTAASLESAAAPARLPAVRADDLAMLQYTSGSTGNPKGVMLTHANLLANIGALGEVVRIGPDDVVVSWLPLYHDMGLISTWLASLYFARPIVVMSPLTFLAKPARWLWAIHRHRGTISAAPNFAYELCLRRIDPQELQGLDLSSWRIAANGAEQVNPDTIERFCACFAAYGFRPTTMMPVYGLAEATVGLVTPPPGRGPLIDRVRRDLLAREGRAEPAAADDASALRFAACGRPLPAHRVRIADGNGAELGERREGRIEFVGPSATQGYYRNPEQTRRLFDGEWLDSGDRGYIAAGDLYVTGRVKDIIIRGGQHIYPDEIEQEVGAIAGVRKGCVAAFPGTDRRTGTERFVILAETRIEDEPARAQLRDAIVKATVRVLGEPPDEVVLAPPGSVLKTSSGKLRRAATRAAYEHDRLGAAIPSAPAQFLQLVAASILPQLRRVLRSAGAFAWAGYAWLLFVLLAIPTYLATLPVRDVRRAWAIGRLGARAFLKLAGIGFGVAGLDNLPARRTCVLVANHTSFIDGLALIAALPVPCAFVAKTELSRSRIARLYLERLGVAFVERFAIRQSAQDADRLVELVRSGRSLIFFPEGTFFAGAGLLAFHLGAFVAAARTNAPVVPVAIRGTRQVLRDDEWFPRRGSIDVTFAPPIERHPGESETTFSTAIALRDAARAAILAGCGEPDVAG